MKYNFRTMVKLLGKAFGTKHNHHQPVRQPLNLEELEDRTAPSSSPLSAGAGQLAVYHSLVTVANDITVAVESAAQVAIANSTPLDQAIGTTFLTNLTNQIQTDLAPLTDITFATPTDGLFGATSDTAFAQKACDFILLCLRNKTFPETATEAADNNVSVTPAITIGKVPANLTGAIVYGTACATICDQIYTTECVPILQELCVDVYDGDDPVLQDPGTLIPNCVNSAETVLPPDVQTQQQAIEACITDPGGVVGGLDQTQTFQLDRADNSLAATTTFTLAVTGLVETSTSVLYDTNEVAMANVEFSYANTGAVFAQDASLVNAAGVAVGNYNSINLGDGTAITVQSLFNAGGTAVQSQVIGFYNANGTINTTVATTDVEAVDNSLLTVQGIDAATGSTNTFTLTNTDGTVGITDGAASTTDSTDTDVTATADYGSKGHAVAEMIVTNYVNGVETGTTVINSDGHVVDNGGGGGGGNTGGGGGGNTGGGGGGNTGGGGGNTGGGGGGNTGGGGGGGNTGGGGGGNTGGGGGGNTGGGNTGGGNTGGGNTGGGGGGDTGGGGGSGSARAAFARGASNAGAANSGGIFLASGNLTFGTAKSFASPPATKTEGIVADFTGADANSADYSALILWSDNTASTGFVSSTSTQNLFTVFGAHQDIADVHPMFVSITDVVNGAQITAIAGGQTASLPFNDTFSGNELSAYWLHEHGAFAVSNNQATALSAIVPNLAVLDGVDQTNVSVQANVGFTTSGQYAGLVTHYNGPGDTNMYVGRLTDVGNGMVQGGIYRSTDGTLTQIGTSQTVAGAGGTLMFIDAGSSLQLFLNGNMVANAQDTNFTGGSVGIQGSAGSTVADFQATAISVTTITLNGTTPGNGTSFGTYTQDNINGPLNLNDTALQLIHLPTGPTAGDSFTIVTTTGGVTGSFIGYPEGATVAAQDGSRFTITYQADGGDDIVLAAITPAGFVYDAATQILTITAPTAGSTFAYSQATALDGSGTPHTTYDFALNGAMAAYPDTQVASVIVSGQGAGNIAILITNDTYVDAHGVTQETPERVSLGSKMDAGAGTISKFMGNNTGNAEYTFLTMSDFNTSYAYVGRNDGTVLLYGTAGTGEVGFVTAGYYSYIAAATTGAYYHEAAGAPSVYGYSAGNANDFAYHYSMNAGSAFVVSGVAFSYMSGSQTNPEDGNATDTFFNVASFFPLNTGVSNNPGKDIAYIIDSPMNDTFAGGTPYSYMYSTDAAGNFTEFDAAYAFALIYAQSFVGGADEATNSDSSHNILGGNWHLLM